MRDIDDETYKQPMFLIRMEQHYPDKDAISCEVTETNAESLPEILPLIEQALRGIGFYFDGKLIIDKEAT